MNKPTIDPISLPYYLRGRLLKGDWEVRVSEIAIHFGTNAATVHRVANKAHDDVSYCTAWYTYSRPYQEDIDKGVVGLALSRKHIVEWLKS